MTEQTSTTYQVPVAGGSLTVGEWRSGDTPVLAIHGLSGTHKLWLWTAAHLAGVRLIAPDLRGRGASQGLEPRYGIAAHRDDMVAVLDHLGIDRVTVVGMSLGGFIAAALVAAVPERVESLVIVDGGLPMIQAATFKHMTKDQLAGVFRDRLARVAHPWKSLAEYEEFFISATGPVLSPEDPVLGEYLSYDLVGEEPSLTVRLDTDYIIEDAADLFLSDQAQTNAGAIRVPTRMLYAEWSIGRGTTPAYNGDSIEPWSHRIPDFQARLLPGTDHAATAMTAEAGAAIAGLIQEEAAR
jgi:pimeloyl-ACP methyl ester carboxylesterase